MPGRRKQVSPWTGANRVCALSELPDGTARSFTVVSKDRKRTVIVVRRGNRLFAFLDRCPHMGTSLLWQDKVLITPDKAHIRCANHDALFRLHDGLCVAGPCASERLSAVPVQIIDEVIWLLASDS
jgi:nitrite reductase/ring-hydroxylating ferredoxin subunit